VGARGGIANERGRKEGKERSGRGEGGQRRRVVEI
jgi:hypothetical protein